jgi:hypothetical protein
MEWILIILLGGVIIVVLWAWRRLRSAQENTAIAALRAVRIDAAHQWLERMNLMFLEQQIRDEPPTPIDSRNGLPDVDIEDMKRDPKFRRRAAIAERFAIDFVDWPQAIAQIENTVEEIVAGRHGLRHMRSSEIDQYRTACLTTLDQRWNAAVTRRKKEKKSKKTAARRSSTDGRSAE